MPRQCVWAAASTARWSYGAGVVGCDILLICKDFSVIDYNGYAAARELGVPESA